MTTNTERKLHTLDQIKRAAQSAGSHWFDRDTLRYFQSRISDNVYPVPGGALFVSSEKFRGLYEPDGERRYTVRSCTAGGRIETVGEFQQYASRDAAHNAARRLVAGGYSLWEQLTIAV
jgi:hypothetical protein